jgi:hypothetical protein
MIVWPVMVYVCAQLNFGYEVNKPEDSLKGNYDSGAITMVEIKNPMSVDVEESPNN